MESSDTIASNEITVADPGTPGISSRMMFLLTFVSTCSGRMFKSAVSSASALAPLASVTSVDVEFVEVTGPESPGSVSAVTSYERFAVAFCWIGPENVISNPVTVLPGSGAGSVFASVVDSVEVVSSS